MENNMLGAYGFSTSSGNLATRASNRRPLSRCMHWKHPSMLPPGVWTIVKLKYSNASPAFRRGVSP
eukprot:CAMPEP_0195578970 /NCGR_PEP_ID=MMETSP0814-20130614/12972_1 /TAXON_ID=97485 /ORGANISM="Prymnesium parvum, Strain Texoma1" /LENGTH=65 /DNA_ID=CAMNT_0040715585 /DNA_START=32 /DNA_END=226 /DNA_ORIENTATION=-